jgi:peptidoglycan/xylan/chitin deacetylase (PgdA/CDA1 family)
MPWGSGWRGGLRLAACGLLVLAVAAGPLTVTAPAATAADCRAGYVALTFDDGPGVYTGRVLDVLAGRKVPSTFFVVGSNVDSRPALVRRMAAEAHGVANHTYRHERLTSLSDSGIVSTVDRADRAIRRAGAPSIRLVRPPYGATSSRVRSVLSNAGYGHILWTIDPRDWERSTSHIRSTVLNNLRDGSVVLLHDGSGNAHQLLPALPDIIDGARARGFCFARLDARGRLIPSDAQAAEPTDWRDDGRLFRDVPPTSTHAEAIARLTDLGVTRGCREEYYCPQDPVSRAQMASFLQRALGLPPGPTDGFRDVAASSTHAAAIGAVHEAGITKGCTDDGRSYCPNDAVRRDQMASFLARAFAFPPGREDHFRDVVPGSTHATAIGAVLEAGVTKGCTDDGRSYCPGERVTRAQMASFIVRALDAAADPAA